MRWTQTFIPTLREKPYDAEVASHVLMLRAGLIRKLSAGVYSYLPLGWRSLRKAAEIVREEMDRAGALEVLLPALQPMELWEESGRTKDFGEDLLTAVDRHGKRNVLGPTHEEVITDLVRNHINSYRQLPKNFYQIQTKFRDEIRPRFGVIRSREFLMKDAYSFDADQESLRRSYQQMYEAYCRIFTRCGLTYVVVEAEAGAIGGDVNHEFMVPTEAGEDIIVSCPGCGYAANRERAAAAAPEPASGPEAQEAASPRLVETPGMTTIDAVSGFLGVSADRLIKTLVYVADGEPVLALVRGDHELNEVKLARALGARELAMADPQTIERATGAPVGFAGPVGLGLRMVADPAVMSLTDAVTGANQADAHLVGVRPGRDFQPDLVADLRYVVPGDRCRRCGGELVISHGIEVGHIFQLGTKYSQALGATYLDDAGQAHPILMGCYGIGVNRIVAAAIEISHDEAGIIFPISIAPYEVLLLAVNTEDSEVMDTAERLYRQLKEAGLEVLFDDRDASPGVKFNDADLVGIPVRVTVGRRGLRRGEVEIKLRREPQPRSVPLSQTVERTAEVVASLKAELEPR